MLDSLIRDARLAFRSLRRSPGFSLVTVLTLALAIGATTAIFSVVNAVLLTPLPFADPGSLVMVWENDRLTGTERESSSVPDYFDFRQRNRSFADLAAFSPGEMNLSREEGEPVRASAAAVTHNLTALLGVSPQLGRPILAEEDRPGGEAVALLSDGFWSRGFGRDPAVLGRTLRLDDEPYTVVGVLPAGVDFPDRDTDLWLPLKIEPTSAPRSRHWIDVVGRLRPGVTVEAAQSDMTAVAAALEEEYSENRARGAFVEPLAEVFHGEVRPALLVLFAAVGAVLLIACANVASLLLARGASRVRETAVRAALGARARHLIRRHLAESLILAAAAALFGAPLAAAGTRALLALAPAGVADLGEVGADPRVLAFTLALTASIALFFALVPTLQARRLDLEAALRERASTGGKALLRRLLVVAQMAAALMLLVSAGLLLASLVELQRVDPGFRAAGVLRADFELPRSRYPRDFSVWPRWAEVHRFHRELLEKVEALPGVRSAAIATSHPLDSGFTNSFVIVGREDEYASQGELKTRLVTDRYFETAGVELLEGRLFTGREDTESHQVLLLNRAAVERYFPDGRAVGEEIRFWGITREVVGVVGNERMQGLGEETPPAMYVPLAQSPPVGGVTLMVRAEGDPLLLAGPVRDAVRALDPDLAVWNVATMDETVARSLAKERFTSLLLALFAAIAVALAAVGVHGVLSYLVSRRRREIGVRVALGASRFEVLRMVVSQGMGLAAAGLALGLAGAVAASRLLSGLLYGVSPLDPLTYALVTAALFAAALLACALPARRATRVDPASVLREE